MRGPNEFNAGAREELPASPLSAAEECKSFSLVFANHLELLRELRSRGVNAGMIPQEVERPSLIPEEIGKLKGKFAIGKLLLEAGKKNRLLPLVKIDPSEKKLMLQVFEIGPESPVPSSEMAGSLEMMSEAIRYINGAADRKRKYPRIYEFIRAVTHYLQSGPPSVDEGKLKEFLGALELSLPDNFSDQVHKRVFNLPRLQAMLPFIFMNRPITVKKDNFREWLQAFSTNNPGVADWLGRMKEIVDKQLHSEFIERFMDEIKSPLQVITQVPVKTRATVTQDKSVRPRRAPGKISGPFMTVPSIPPEGFLKKHSMVPLPLLKRKSLEMIRDGVAKSAAAVHAISGDGAPGNVNATPQAAVVQAPIIDLVESVEDLARDLIGFLKEQKLHGARFTGIHMLVMCDLLFDNAVPWIQDGKIRWQALEAIGLANAFDRHPKRGQAEKDLITHLFKLKIKLVGRGYLGSPQKIEEARRKFVLAVSALNKQPGPQKE